MIERRTTPLSRGQASFLQTFQTRGTSLAETAVNGVSVLHDHARGG
jgi:hypothetical protein